MQSSAGFTSVHRETCHCTHKHTHTKMHTHTHTHMQILSSAGFTSVHLEAAGERVIAHMPRWHVAAFLTWAAMQPISRFIDEREVFVLLTDRRKITLQLEDKQQTFGMLRSDMEAVIMHTRSRCSMCISQSA